MSTARVHYVKSARQRYAKVAKLDEEGKQVITPVMRKSGAARTAKSGREVVRRIRVADKGQPLPMPKCGKCGQPIEVGQPYLWYTVGFRGYPQYRHINHQPKPSELESSRVADIIAAIEDAQDQIDNIDADNRDDAESQAQEILQSVQDVIDEVKEEYAEADRAMGDSQATQAYERYETLDANDLGSFSLQASDPEGCGDAWKGDSDDDADADDHDEPQDGCDECRAKLDEWQDEVRQEVRDALEEVELP